MIIKRDKEYRIMVIAVMVCAIIAGYIFYMGLGLSVSGTLAAVSPVMLLIFLHAVGYGRTFTLAPDGCTVRFLCFEKTYLWDQFKTKKIISTPKHPILAINRAYPYQQYAVFAPFRIRKPRWLNPIYYNFIHPWSFVYINLDNSNTKTRRERQSTEYKRRGRHYEASEQEFREKMSLWHIALEE